MAESDAPHTTADACTCRTFRRRRFSSEKREDIWALIIAMVILLLSVAFPAQIHHFFSSMLYLF